MLRCALAFAAAFLLASPAAAQVQRSFPQNALRGTIVFGTAPEIAVNGQPARLAPGSRIRDACGARHAFGEPSWPGQSRTRLNRAAR